MKFHTYNFPQWSEKKKMKVSMLTPGHGTFGGSNMNFNVCINAITS